MIRIYFGMLILFSVFTSHIALAGGIKMPYFFSDNMVLQRQKPIQLWGTASPKSSFSIDFNGEKKNIKAGSNGDWKVTFPALEAGGPYEIKVMSDSAFSFKNVMIGDVWLCSGQSNMEWPVSKVFNASYELRNADLPQIRSFTVAREISTNPQNNTTKALWQTCTPENAASFSAVAYFFAKKIYKTQHIPIGIIHTSWGGTFIEPWIGLKSMNEHPDFKELADKFNAKYKGNNSLEMSQQRFAKDSQNWLENLQKADSGFVEKWYSPAYKPVNWKKLIAPGYWENHGLPDFDGVVWLRKEVNVPASMAGKPLLLNLETLKDYDITYFNGTEIARGTWQPGRRIYTIPKELVKEGKNLISIRLENLSGFGGFTSRDASQLWLKELAESDNPLILPLSGEWFFKGSLPIGAYPTKPADPSENRKNPSVIYNAMIAPFADLGLKGFLWYQGEANASDAAKYKKSLPLLISDWRKQFNQGELPFIIAQLAGFGALTSNPVESNWAELREAQMATLSVPQTGMAVTIDVGNPYDVHPIYKQQVGERMAAEARRMCYGESDLQTSPLYQSMQIEGNMIRLKFKYAGIGLKSKEGALKGFAIAGEDKRFVWAKTKIEGNEVIVWQEGIDQPKHVRYAWAGSPVESNGANLYNNAGYPASPFRTDNP
jgi:sialate O-acetylesterase